VNILIKSTLKDACFHAGFFAVDTQPEVGEDAYDIGAEILYNFFQKSLMVYEWDTLTDLGKQIFQCFYDRGSVNDFKALMPS
jgi:hypothetical protein